MHWVGVCHTWHSSYTLIWVVSVRIDAWCHIDAMCDVIWVQTTRLEWREHLHWVSACHTWHNSHTLTCVVSVCIDVLLDAHWCVWCWCVCEYSEHDWRWGSKCTESLLATLEAPHRAWLKLWVCILICYLMWWCHIDVMCVSIVNKIRVEGAKSLSHCLGHLTRLTHLYLRSECVHWFVTWCVIWWCDVWV